MSLIMVIARHVGRTTKFEMSCTGDSICVGSSYGLLSVQM